METNVKKIRQDGIEISLMNGSKWMLKNMGDLSKTTLWYPSQRITIEEYNNNFSLVNLDTFTPDKIDVVKI